MKRNCEDSTAAFSQQDIDDYLDACMNGEIDEVMEILAKAKRDEQMLQLLKATKVIDERERTGLGLAFNQHHFDVVAGVVTFISESDHRTNLEILCIIFPYTGALEDEKVITNLLAKIASKEHRNNRIKVLQAQTNWGWTPLVVASAMYGNEKVVEALLKQLDEHGSLKSVLLVQEHDNEFTALHWACKSGHTKIAKELLEACSDPRNGNCNELVRDLVLKQGRYGMTFLHIACTTHQNESIEDLVNIISRTKNLLKELVLKTDDFGHTAFHTCCIYGQNKAMGCLLKQLDKPSLRGALQKMLVLRDNLNMTAIHHALRQKQRGIIEMLLEKMNSKKLQEILIDDMDMTRTAPRGKNLLHFACFYENNNTCQVILDKVDLNTLKSAFRWKDNAGRTALHVCAYQGNAEIARTIVTAAAQKGKEVLEEMIFETNNDDQTALHVSCYEGYREVASAILDEVDEFQLKKVMTAKDYWAKDALHIACSRNNFSLFSELLKYAEKMEPYVARECICMPVVEGKDDSDVNRNDDFEIITIDADDESDEIVPDSENDAECVEGLLHESCKQRDIRILDKVLNFAQKTKCVERLLSEYNKVGKTAFWEMFEMGDHEKIQFILNFAKKTNYVQFLLKNTTKQKDGFFHFALQNKTLNVKCLDTIIRTAREADPGLLLELLNNKVRGMSHLNFISEARNDILKSVMKADTEGQIFTSYLQKSVRGKGETTFHKAAQEKDTTLMSALHKSIKHLKDEKGFLEILKQILCQQDENNQSALHIACKQNKYKLVKILLELAGLVNCLKTLLPLQNQSKQSALHLACRQGDLKSVQILLESASRPCLEEVLCVKDENEQTVLHLACQQDKQEITKEILKVAKNNKCLEDFALKEDKMKQTFLFNLHNAGKGMIDLLAKELAGFDIDKIQKSLSVQNEDQQSVQNEDQQSVQKDKKQIAQNEPKCLNLIIPKLLTHKDQHEKTVLHYVPVNQMTWYMAFFDPFYKYKLQLSKTKAAPHTRLLCQQDENGQSVLHVACKQNKHELLKILLELAGLLNCLSDLLPLQSHSKQSALHIACEQGDLKSVQILLEFATGSCLEKLLCIQDEREQTVLHHACQQDKLEITKEILKAAKRNKCLEDFALKADKMKQTFLFNLHNAGKGMIDLLAKELSEFDIDKIKKQQSAQDEAKQGAQNGTKSLNLLIPQLLIHTDQHEKTVLHYTPRNQMAWYSAFLDHFYTYELELSKSKAKSSTPKFSSQNSGLINNLPPKEYHLFHPDKEGRDLLDVIGDAECLELVKHKYTQSYLLKSWWPVGICFYWLFLLFYAFLLGSLIFFVVTHEYVEHKSKKNNTTELVFEIPSEEDTSISQIILIVFSALNLLFEFCLMKGRTWSDYWLSIDNDTDLLIGLLCTLVSVYSFFAGYPWWIHEIGLALIIATSVNFIWMLTKVAIFSYPRVQRIRLLCIMLFDVMKNVIIFMPIYFLFIVAFSGVFHTVFRRQDPFNEFGHAVMKTIVMSIGELEFKDMFFPDTCNDESDSENEPLTTYPFSFILFFAFLIIMTISTMNLLIGMAVGDIRNRQENSEILAYQILIERIKEGRAVMETLKYIWMCCKCSTCRKGEVKGEAEKPLMNSQDCGKVEATASTSM